MVKESFSAERTDMDDDADSSSDLAEAKATPHEKKEPLDSFTGSYLRGTV